MMLEICLPGGGLRGVVLAGALSALRNRGVVPDVITGVSSGAQVSYLVYGDKICPQVAFQYFREGREIFMKKSFRRAFSAFDPGTGLGLAEKYGCCPSMLKDIGIRHIFVGYTQLPNFKFIIEDILESGDQRTAYEAIYKSSFIPYVTGNNFHFSGAIDGGFRYNYFPSPLKNTKRWLFTYDTYGANLYQKLHSTRFDRVIALPLPFRNPIYTSDENLKKGWAVGHQIGAELSINA